MEGDARAASQDIGSGAVDLNQDGRSSGSTRSGGEQAERHKQRSCAPEDVNHVSGPIDVPIQFRRYYHVADVGFS